MLLIMVGSFEMTALEICRTDVKELKLICDIVTDVTELKSPEEELRVICVSLPQSGRRIKF